MGSVGSTESHSRTNPQQQIETTAERVIVDPPFDVQAETASTVNDLVIHTHLHRFDKENAVEAEIRPRCHDKDQIALKFVIVEKPNPKLIISGNGHHPDGVSKKILTLEGYAQTKRRSILPLVLELVCIRFQCKHLTEKEHKILLHSTMSEIQNEVLDLLVACGLCSVAHLLNLYETKPGQNSRLLIKNAGEPSSRPDTDYSAVVAGAQYIAQRLRKHRIGPEFQVSQTRYDCAKAVERALVKALNDRESQTYIKNKLGQIKAGHLLPVVTAAAERTIKILMFSHDPRHWRSAMDLVDALTDVRQEHVGFDLDELRARVLTRITVPELEAYRRWIEPLDLLFSEIEVQQDPNAARPYVSTRDADDVLHYAWLLGKIEYFEADEILPLLKFVAREAQGEALDHRHALRDEVSNIADALERYGPKYAKKVGAIRDWMETRPFG
jgi:hypothetical protein